MVNVENLKRNTAITSLELSLGHPQKQFQVYIESSAKGFPPDFLSKNPPSLNTPLPNGELPLVFAVKEGAAPEVVKALVTAGADPLKKDDQNLNAVEYAKLMKNDQLLAVLIDSFVATQVAETQKLLQAPLSADDIAKAMGSIAAVRRGSENNLSKLSQVHAAAFRGDIPTLLQQTNDSLFLARDSQGWNALHHAIRGNQLNAVKHIATQFPKTISQLTNNGESSLHLAALAEDPKIFEYCLTLSDKKNELNTPNKDQLSPLHFAAWGGRLDYMRALANKGADVRCADARGVTPLALVGEAAAQNDPLKVSKQELVLFVATLAVCASQFLSEDFLGQVGSQNVLPFLNSALSLTVSLACAKTWKGLVASLVSPALFQAFIKYPTLRLLSMAHDAFYIGTLTKSIFNGLSSCWRNLSLGKGKALIKAVVCSAPPLHSVVKTLSSHFQSSKLLRIEKAGQDLIGRRNACNEFDEYSFYDPCIQKAEQVHPLCLDENNEAACISAKDDFDKAILGYGERATKIRQHQQRREVCARFHAFSFFQPCIQKSQQVHDICLTENSEAACAKARVDFDKDITAFAAKVAEKTKEHQKRKDACAQFNVFSVHKPCIQKSQDIFDLCLKPDNNKACQEARTDFNEYIWSLNLRVKEQQQHFQGRKEVCDRLEFVTLKRNCMAKSNQIFKQCVEDNGTACTEAVNDFTTHAARLKFRDQPPECPANESTLKNLWNRITGKKPRKYDQELCFKARQNYLDNCSEINFFEGRDCLEAEAKLQLRLKGEAVPADCDPIDDPKIFSSMTDEERITSEELNPRCKEHALLILNSNTNDCASLKKDYRKLSKTVHADKTRRKDSKAESAFLRLQTAYETLCAKPATIIEQA